MEKNNINNEKDQKTIEIKPIGIIHSPYKTLEECPVQGVVKPQGTGSIEIFSEYAEGLQSIESFSHLFLFYIFDRAGEVNLIRPPFLDDNPRGVFASRHPCRPNGLGMSIVKLVQRVKNMLYICEVDILDQTPLVDIKPYVPKFDRRKKATNGWLADIEIRDKPSGRE